MKQRFESDQIVRLTDDRPTVDLCCDEHDGVRCTRLRGHEGRHETVTWHDGVERSWD
jgi:hypothetical protein